MRSFKTLIEDGGLDAYCLTGVSQGTLTALVPTRRLVVTPHARLVQTSSDTLIQQTSIQR